LDENDLRLGGVLRDVEVRDNRTADRYELLDGDLVVGFLDYVEKQGRLYLTHAEVLPHLRGRGYGTRLVEGSLDAAHEQRRNVIPVCPFVVAYCRRRAA
jgi:uncharacterized protein